MASLSARLVRVRDGLTPSEWTRVGGMAAVVVGLNVAGWVMLAAAVGGHYRISSTEVFGFGTGILAYTLGMRHAFDADHIAAIDNTTRKLMQDGQRPVGVGLFFSLGHSTIVVALSVLVALSAGVISDIPTLQDVGGLIGTSVSAAFLLIIGVINLVVLVDISAMFRKVSGGGAYDEQSLEDFLNNRGLLARLLRPMLRIVR